jgi:chromosome segregation ATPase
MTQQQITQEPEKTKRCAEIRKQLTELQTELNSIKKDLASARSAGHETGPIYSEKQDVENRIKKLEYDQRIYCYPTPNTPQVPDLKERQFIISTSTVRRKIDAALVIMDPNCNNKVNR